ncbi:MAG: hypothetical protein HYZ34_08610 [Ignavibacteriae bacterium]|nr:hypothetical protein [Ignavibacteriota bacterium]
MRHLFLCSFICLSSVFSQTGTGSYHSNTDTLFLNEIIAKEIAWIADSQQYFSPGNPADGAIPTHRSETQNSQVSPYFSTLAAIGLLEDSARHEHARRYMDWYFRHLNRNDIYGLSGTIYDYEVTPAGEEIQTTLIDATDSYAAMFLVLLQQYVTSTNDTQYMLDHKLQIDTIINVMVATQQSDGLTWAKPDYHLKYVMDNAEVFMGFEAASWLAENVFREPALADSFSNRKQHTLNGIRNLLWDSLSNSYKPYIDEAGFGPTANWLIFYPDAVAQLFPIYGEVSPATEQESKQLYTTFNLYHPQWSSISDSGQDFPWAFLSYCAMLMGDTTRADSFFLTSYNRFIQAGHPYPWHTAEAAFLIRAAALRKISPVRPTSGTWHCFSLPFIMNSNNVDSLLPKRLTSVFRFQHGYQQCNTLENGVGYWVKLPAGDSIRFDGTPTDSESLHVDEGWNLIGSISEIFSADSLVSVPDGIIISSLFEFQNGYVSSDSIEPGNGYWVKVSQSGIIILDALPRNK